MKVLEAQNMPKVSVLQLNLCFCKFLKQSKNRCQKGIRKLSFWDHVRYWGRPWLVDLFIVLKMFCNNAKSLSFDVDLNVNAIDQKGSKGAPGTARVVSLAEE